MRLSSSFRNIFPTKGAAIERRLHNRVITYWNSARGKRELVNLGDFNPLAIEDQFSHGFILDLRNQSDPVFTYIGPVLEQEAGLAGSRCRFAEVPEASLLVRFASHYPRVLESRAPQTAEYDFTTQAGYHVLCRGALLPLSSNNITVDHVYGVISWKSEKLASSSLS